MTTAATLGAQGLPGVETTFLTAGDPRWRDVLPRLGHDIYQLPEYVRFAASHQEAGTPINEYLAGSDDHLLMIPMIERQLPSLLRVGSTLVDATSPRGFSGPVVGRDPGSDADAFADAALAALRPALRHRGIVSAFIRLHPLLGPSREVLERHGTLVDIGESVSIDIGISDEELWRQMRLNHRRDIMRARKAGYVARIDEGWRHLDGFVQAYQRSMARLDASPHWRFSREYFVDLRDAMKDRIHLCVVELGDDLASASLLTETDGIAEYHLAGTLDHHVAASPSKLIIQFACAWARARGNRLLHLAGSPKPGDSLSHFKLGFSPRRHRMQSWRVVADEAAYASLMRSWQGLAGTPSDSDDDFFPGYRKPFSAGSG